MQAAKTWPGQRECVPKVPKALVFIYTVVRKVYTYKQQQQQYLFAYYNHRAGGLLVLAYIYQGPNTIDLIFCFSVTDSLSLWHFLPEYKKGERFGQSHLHAFDFFNHFLADRLSNHCWQKIGDDPTEGCLSMSLNDKRLIRTQRCLNIH